MIPRLVRRFFKSPRNFRRLMNLWPPLWAPARRPGVAIARRLVYLR